jgi:hypothetical protein
VQIQNNIKKCFPLVDAGKIELKFFVHLKQKKIYYTPNSSAFEFGNIFRTGWPNLRDVECERIKCKWTIGAARWALKI